MDSRIKRQGEYLEKLGYYDPMGKPEDKVTVDVDRVVHWVDQGAQATDKVATILKLRGLNLTARAAEKVKSTAASK